MHFHSIVIIYFLYGLAFFSMGLLVIVEGDRASDLRLRRALRPLAGFGIIHGIHEWVEMFENIEILLGHDTNLIPEYVRLALLAISFISLIAFGIYLLAYTENAQRFVNIVPVGLEAVWVFGLAVFRGQYPPDQIWAVADVWTRYTLAIPGGILAAIGLIAQQRAFRRSGLTRFGQDALWAAVAFAWYGIVGQFFVRISELPPSHIINQELFMEIFGFPVQLFRATMAIAAAVFVVRFLRAFQVESEEKISELQTARITEAEQREKLRGELFRRVVDAQEAERQRIARDLHDETGQALTAIGMGLRGLSTTIKNMINPKQSTETLRELETLTADSLRELQRLIADLRPSHLDDLGLASTMRWYANTIQERTNLNMDFEILGNEKTICPEYATALFRIFQEAVNNVIKHANANNVNVQLVFTPQNVTIRVDDDGQGFSTDKLDHRSNWGIAGMQERASLLEGQFFLESEPGKGTLVEISVPYCPIHSQD
jgi:signal transduction histidine kinase